MHDYTCSVCGTPRAYQCAEPDGECTELGIGEDHAFVDLFFFSRDDAPPSAAAFEERIARARRRLEQHREYDWGSWEFVPSLNYRTLLMEDEDAAGIWHVRPFEAHHEGSPIEGLQVPQEEVVWAVNYCPECHARFVTGSKRDPPCRLYLEQVSEHLGVRWEGDKAAFEGAVRDVVARRRAPAPAG